MSTPVEGGTAAADAVSQHLLRQVLVVGAGLMGTSVALALRAAGIQVWLADQNAEHVQLASQLGAGQPWSKNQPDQPDLVVIAVPIPYVAEQVYRWQQLLPAVPVTDVSSAVLPVRQQAAAAGVNLATFISGHPLAGGEKSGPAAARAQMFVGRSWFVVDEPGLDLRAVQVVQALVLAVGAQVVRSSALAHDQAVALTSHVPHVLASALAGQLQAGSQLAVQLAGPSIREMTRVAGAEPKLWSGILLANAGQVAQVLEPIAQDLLQLAQVLQAAAESAQCEQAVAPTVLAQLDQVLSRGVAGRTRLL